MSYPYLPPPPLTPPVTMPTVLPANTRHGTEAHVQRQPEQPASV